MSFKIVQTIEHGGIFLTTVPSAWEQGGQLFWPTSRKPKCMAKMLRDANSQPELGWTSQPCLKKREYSSFDAAELEISRMQSNSDTEGFSGLLQSPPPHKKKKQSREAFGVDKDFNYMCKEKSFEMDEVINIDEVNNMNSAQEDMSVNEFLIRNGVTPGPEVPIIDQSYPNSFSPSEDQFVNIDEQSTTVDLTGFIKNTSEKIQEICENLDKVVKELAKQRVFHEMYIELFTHLKENQTKQILPELAAPSVELKFPIDSEEELDKIELHLSDTKNMNDLIAKMQTVCGDSGTRNAVTSSYQLVDKFFTRKFLLHVSWSGGSRCDERKLGLRNYKNTLAAFTSIIKLAAGSFDEQKCKDFFAVVLRNSKQRTDKKPNVMQRASAQKQFQKKQSKDEATIVKNTTEHVFDMFNQSSNI